MEIQEIRETLKQMYGGEVDMAAFAAVAAAAKIPVVFNGDAPFPPEGMPPHGALAQRFADDSRSSRREHESETGDVGTYDPCAASGRILPQRRIRQLFI